jgi:sigma-B regulation protein RsbU (phosphoserine phosphatase)
MSPSFTRGITFKLTIAVLGLTSLIFVGIITYGHVYSRKIMLKEAEQNARHLAQSTAWRIEQEFRSVAKIPEGLARYLEVRPCRYRETLLALIRAAVSENREIFGSAVAYEPYAFAPGLRYFAPYYYKDGTRLRFVDVSESYNYTQKDWFHIPEVLRAPVWTQPYYDEGGGNILMVTYSVPFFKTDPDGKREKVRGIVTSDVSLEWLNEIVSSIKVGATGQCFILSDVGKFVTSSDKDVIMRESIFSLAEERGEPELRRIGRAMIRGDSGFTDLGTDLTGRDSYLAYARIPSTGWSLGTIYPKDELFADVRSLFKRTLILAVVGVLALLAVSVLVAKSIARPLRRMAGAAARVGAGDLEIDLTDIRSRDEVGQLARAFTQMTEGLKERDFIRDTFGRYLTREVVERLLESEDGLKLGGRSKEISMLMSDLRGFTSLASRMPAERVIEILNRYLGKMLDILIDHRGTVDEIIGDGILAFFGAPEDMEDHCERAVACALKMQVAMDEINEINEKEGLPYLEMGIAVNTGEVVVGNIGSERRAKYGAVGSQVNFTGRMESYTVGGQVLISRSSYEPIAELVDVREIIKVHMKGMPHDVTLYDVKGIGGRHPVSLKERDVKLFPLKEEIEVKLYRLDEKIVKGSEIAGRITHVSAFSARMTLPAKIKRWENVRVLLVDGNVDTVAGEIYGKVVSAERDGTEYGVLVRITSTSPQVRKMFREAGH